jgi:NDP-sugar pyrophosphorylase family protein
LLGAANTIFEISKFVDGPLLVVHGDLVLSNDYVSALAKSVLNFPRFSVVCHFRSADNARSKVLTDNSGLILTLQNSKNVVNYGSEILVNSGIYYFPTLEDLGGRPELSSEITDSILQSLINRKKLYSINLEFERISVDSLLQLHQARELVIKEKSSQ